MSGQKDVLHEIFNEALFNIPEEPQNTPSKRKRIDFSRFKGEASHLRETEVSQEEMQFMFIRSFSRGSDELFSEGTCTQVCHASDSKSKCLLELLNESTLEIYLKGEGEFDQLFASINFDTLTASLQYEHIPENRQISYRCHKLASRWVPTTSSSSTKSGG
jgi:hypothetical protein